MVPVHQACSDYSGPDTALFHAGAIRLPSGLNSGVRAALPDLGPFVRVKLRHRRVAGVRFLEALVSAEA
jgi:hypothetical protein